MFEVKEDSLIDSDILLSLSLDIPHPKWFSIFDDGFSFFSLSWIVGVLSFLWTFYSFLAYIISFILLLIYIYAAIRRKYYSDLITEKLRNQEEAYDKLYRSGEKDDKLRQILTHIESDRPSDWRLAIIEADILLDEKLKELGYAGKSLGERLRSISSRQLRTIDDAWQAHKIRNKIAHVGSDFILTKKIAEDTISKFLRVFAELDIK